MTWVEAASTLGGVRLIGRDGSGLGAARTSEQPKPAGLGRTQVLIADPDRELVELIAYLLRRAGLRYATALDAPSALERFASLGPSVVVLDTNGLDLLHQFTISGHNAAIIVLTTADTEDDRVSALERGADDYVTKPFSPRELLARIRACLRRNQLNSPSVASPVVYSSRGSAR